MQDDAAAAAEKSLVAQWAAELKGQQHFGVKLLTPLPWRVRLRLWFTGHIDGVACWLVEHVHPQAGAYLWRASGLWR